MCKNCYTCDGFIPISQKLPCNPLDFIVGNRIGVCNETEWITPLSEVVEDCELWTPKEYK